MANKIFAFGDSILKGVAMYKDPAKSGSVKYHILSDSFVSICEKDFGKSISNYARFGSTILTGKRNFDTHLKDINPGDIVVFEFGGNDCNYNWKEISDDADALHLPATTIDEFKHTYCQMIEDVRSKGARPILLSLPPIDHEKFIAYAARGCNMDGIYKWLGGRLEYISVWHEKYNLEIFKMGMEKKVDVIDITSTFTDHHDYSKFLCEDGIHPNGAGHALIGEALRNQLLPCLAQA